MEISNTKFGKDRLVPFGPKLAVRLREYRLERERRDHVCTGAHHLFSWNGRTPISTNSIRNTFRDDLLPQLNLTVPPGCFGPHVHGLRHSSRCERCWAGITGIIPGDRHAHTFLGHVNPKSTAVYLTITNELLDAANERFELFAPLLTAGGSS